MSPLIVALIVYAVWLTVVASWLTWRLLRVERELAHLRMDWAEFDARFGATKDDPQAD